MRRRAPGEFLGTAGLPVAIVGSGITASADGAQSAQLFQNAAVIGVVLATRTVAVPAAVGAWVAGAIYFTPSAAFANPAVTVARALTDTYTGIAPQGVPLFVAAQFVGAALAAAVVGLLFQPDQSMASEVVVPHDR